MPVATSPANVAILTNRSLVATEVLCGNIATGEYAAIYNENSNGYSPLIFVEKYPSIVNAKPLVNYQKYETFINNLIYTASINDYNRPNQSVNEWATAIYSFFIVRDIENMTIVPLKEGGIGFEFIHKHTYYNIKLDNEGDGVFYKEEPNQSPKGWDYNFAHLLRKINSEFDGL